MNLAVLCYNLDMNIIKNKSNNHAPSLEEYRLDFSVYSDYQEKKQDLEKMEGKFENSIRSIEKNDLLNLVLVTLFLATWIAGFYFFSLLFDKYEFAFVLCITWIGFPVVAVALENYFRNLFTLGNYEKIKILLQKTKQDLNFLKEIASKKVENFENDFCDYYQNQLDKFYSERLYKKRSGTAEFEESLAEFEAITNDLNEANKILLTKHFDLWGYEDYLEKRKGNHFVQRDKAVSKEFALIGDFVKKVSETKSKKIELSPEEKYRIPRKIDWEKINKNNSKTGLKGEEIVFEVEKNYLKEIGANDLAEKVRHVAKEDGDGLGYDVLSFFPNGKEKYIEVKSTQKSIDSQYYISRNELGFLQENQENSFIYRIQISDENETLLSVKTAHEILNNSDIVPVQFIVKAKQ